MLLLAITAGMTSCNGWLDLDPQNKQTSGDYWQKQQDVEAVLTSCYLRMRECADDCFFRWGEVRGDGVTLGADAAADLRKIKELDILPENSLNDWAKVYRVIGSANSVIRYAPEVFEKDPMFEEIVMRAYVAEAVFLRSLCYFYLVRTFGEVPFVTEPYVDDKVSFKKGKDTEAYVLEQITADLLEHLRYAKPGHEYEIDNKTRATRWASFCLLAEIYLWQEQYDDCLRMCDTVLNSGRFEFVEDGELWFLSIFEEEYSTESVFELEYNTTTASGDNTKIRSTNNFVEWCVTKSHFIPGETIEDLYREVPGINDLRGVGASMAFSGNSLILTKYAAYQMGTGMTMRANGDANWIFYRISDILLMKAEALAMKQKFQESVEIVNRIRKRAGYQVDLRAGDTDFAALEIVIQERRRELLMEGKRWFDVVRVARKNNYQYKSYLIDVVLQGVSAAQRPRYESLLANPLSWYLPILQKQIDDNTGVLEQNPYYANEN